MATTAPSTSSPAKRVIDPEEWNRRMDAVKISKSDLNQLVMNYLIIEGYQSAAIKFAQEANITPSIDLDSINERMVIRQAIHRGDVQGAIERINELDPELLDTVPSLHFQLLRLQLVELIRASGSGASETGDISTALAFATTHLAPRAPSSPTFLHELEKTMALLAFPPESISSSSSSTSPLAELVDPNLRRDVAKMVNEAILEHQGIVREAKAKGLVRAACWAEERLRGEGVEFPVLDLEALVGKRREGDAMEL
ncbi:hypothetical protein SAICODRAFT_29801 [Saitoella complicata NRRL Y-17804]|uniref:uncharacterized protein n=1 Tax=Saitoella complicata (strain BCRC 22490 / CBS 7301 / JCM 7358 / NBRC 10748 / NRRL Y-17804) TaxID=698492 RepID=UPI0008668C46|nr:uncharacterized protein SAICODRAFT_29801 [Saitoella complicata NRRL Y-17804]ODQ53809.1 hypothetical protein SAICODRAFT_29801 [Saitoella complicata NRRL Y-17804]